MPDGTFHTRVNALPVGKVAKSHHYLMRNLFEQVSPDAAPYSLEDACMGGGTITTYEDSPVEWGSSTLLEVFKKDRPADEATANALIAEIRTWVEAKLKSR